MSRFFKLVSSYDDETLLPERATKHSAGYDFKAAERTIIPPGEIALVQTGVKASMNEDEVLLLFDRSSNPRKRGIVLSNSVGVIDADYYDNDGNEGLIYGQFTNITDRDVIIEYGDTIMQGVFVNFKLTDNDTATNTRIGGFGSTGN